MVVGTALSRLLSFALPIGLGVLVFVFAVQGSKPPEQAPVTERKKTVRVLEVAATDFIPRVNGYGSVEPVRVWEAVAQVSGRVDYVHPNLRRGSVLKAGTEIIRISPKDYDLAVRQAEADLEAAQAKLAELEAQAANAEKSIEIEKRSLQLTQNDIERKRQLADRNTVSQLTVEDAERSRLTQQARVQDLENSILLFPSRINAQRQQIDVENAQLETARLNLERTRIVLPFDGRISLANVEETQFAAIGVTLATADDIGGAEIKAEIPQARFRVFTGLTVPADFKQPELSDDTLGKVIEQIGWTAVVRLNAEEQPATWPARVLRTSDTIDAKTRTVGAIVLVDKPYEDIKIGTKPPLVKGMFVEVELSGRPIKDQIVIPRAAVRDGAVFVADDEDRLRIRPVVLQAEQGDQALISSGLQVGDRVVLSDLSPAIDGMLLEPVAEPAPGDPRSVALGSAPSAEAAK